MADAVGLGQVGGDGEDFGVSVGADFGGGGLEFLGVAAAKGELGALLGEGVGAGAAQAFAGAADYGDAAG